MVLGYKAVIWVTHIFNYKLIFCVFYSLEQNN